MSVPLARLPPFVAVGAGHPVASYYPEASEAEVRIYRYAPDIVN